MCVGQVKFTFPGRFINMLNSSTVHMHIFSLLDKTFIVVIFFSSLICFSALVANV